MLGGDWSSVIGSLQQLRAKVDGTVGDTTWPLSEYGKHFQGFDWGQAEPQRRSQFSLIRDRSAGFMISCDASNCRGPRLSRR
jgi:hypothetical protein